MDKISKEKRSKNMQKIKSFNTKPEIILRKLIFSMGYRYRIHYKKLPGKPDIVFPGKKKVIFVHGCFWHQHNAINCRFKHNPKSNKVYWDEKFKKNNERDKRNQLKLKNLGWRYLIIWECEIKKKNPETLSKNLITFLENKKK